MRYQSDPKIESKYWETINTFSKKILSTMDYDFKKLSYQDILKEYGKIVNEMSDADIEKLFKFKFDAMKIEGKME